MSIEMRKQPAMGWKQAEVREGWEVLRQRMQGIVKCTASVQWEA